MALITVQDRAHEFRMTITGKLAAESAREGRDVWQSALAEALPRRITVDISGLTGYDGWGRKWLREMYQHGTHISAATPESLMFLADVTAPRRGPVTVLSTGNQVDTKPRAGASFGERSQNQLARAAGSGQ